MLLSVCTFLCIQRERFEVNKASPSRHGVKVSESEAVAPGLEQLGSNQDKSGRNQQTSGKKNTPHSEQNGNSVTLQDKFKLKTGQQIRKA